MFIVLVERRRNDTRRELGWAGLEGNLKLKPVPWQQQPHHYNTPYYISSYDLSSALHQI